LNVKGMKPVLNMQIAGSGLVGEPMTATLTVSYPGVKVSAEGMDVEWTVSGAEVLHQRSLTDENGKAVIEIISYNPITAGITAYVSGSGISTGKSASSYTFEHPEGYVEVVESDNFGMGGLVIEDTQLIYIIVPGAIAGTFLFLKRTNRLEGITERLPLDGLGEKFEGIKDRVSEIRERD